MLKIEQVCNRKCAFTLAEVLITLVVIGIVAVLTIPAMIKNHNQKTWDTAKNIWEKKIIEVTRQMNIDDRMVGSNSTEVFVNNLKDYLQIIKLCDNSHLEQCYSSEVVLTAGDEVVVSKLKSAAKLGHTEWATNTVAFVQNNGTTAILAYDPNCEYVDPYSEAGQKGQTACLSAVVDVNGKKGPNKIGMDVLLNNAVLSSCDLQIGKLCLASSDLNIEPINTCEASPDHKYDTRLDSQNTYCSKNYWGGAKKMCESVGMKLPTLDDLAAIATYLFKLEDTPLGPNDSYTGTADPDRRAELHWNTAGNYWSDSPSGDYNALARHFQNNLNYPSSVISCYIGERQYVARCVE